MKLSAINTLTFFRIQVLHVLQHDGEGGQTLLVDGFFAAEKLRAQDPDAFDFLTQAAVSHEYFEEGQGIRSVGKVLTTHPTTGQMLHIRFVPLLFIRFIALSEERCVKF